MNTYQFPNDFIWGAATAAFQIEGANKTDGRGESTWDRFCLRPGKVAEGHTGKIACDHYHRYRDDVALMKKMGLKHYRFSTAWPRILPEGEGRLNEKGLDFYSRLTDELLNAGIEPMVTLFHWDLPQALQDKYGGWKSRKVPELFAQYAEIMGRRLGDRIKRWTTINEIICFTTLAHREDRHAPGGLESQKVTNQSVHNALLGHGLALKALRDSVGQAQIGLVENIDAPWPFMDTPEHRRAALSAWEGMNSQRLFPLMRGCYDEELYTRHYGELPDYSPEDMEVISRQMDYLGINFYWGPPVEPGLGGESYRTLTLPPAWAKTDMDWPVTADALYSNLLYLRDFFPGIPLYITENGQAAADEISEDGVVRDYDRIDYIRNHLKACRRAIQEGVPLKGYYHWSLMDNFEWTMGYTRRFGLVRVEYDTQKRIIKESGKYYSRVIKENRVL